MMAYLIRVNVVALMVLVFLGVGAANGESSDATGAAILKRLDEMARKMQKMESEIKTLKEQNEELRAKLEDVGSEKAGDKEAVKAGVVKRPPVKIEPLIANKPFKGGVQVEAEYLHLRATRDAAPYAGTISGVVGNNGTIDAKGETKFDRDGAWRFALSYAAPTGWDGGVKYTHFKTQGDSSVGQRGVDSDGVWVNRLDRSLADDVLNADFDDGIADYAEEELKLSLDIWDLELGHTFRTTDYTAFRFSGGLRHIDMDNDSRIRYENINAGNLQVALIDEHLDMKGYGGRIGGSFMWDIWDTGLSVNFGSALSLVYASFKTYRHDDYRVPGDSGVREITTDIDSFLPIIDLNLGVKYQYKAFFVEGGYMFSYWFNGDLKHRIGLQDDVDGGTNAYDYEKADLMLHGWTINAGILF
jgi:hypothetical protein